MAITRHPDIELVSGTDWAIAGTLYDATGKPLDITNCTLAWVLLDPDGNALLPFDPNITITKTDAANGAIQIAVPETYTRLRPGRYTDTLQVTAGTNIDIFWMGQILVAANPINTYQNITELPEAPPAPTPIDAVIVVPPWWWFYGRTYY